MEKNSASPLKKESSMANESRHLHADINGLLQRLTGTEASLSEFKASVNQSLQAITQQLGHLSNQITAGQRTPWGTLFGGISALGALIIFFVFQPLQSNLTAQNTIIELMRTEINNNYKENRNLLDTQGKYFLDNTVPYRTYDTQMGDLKEQFSNIMERLNYLERSAHPH